MEQALVLNASFEPLCVADLGRAVVLVLSGRASTVEDTGRLLRSPSTELFAPAVIRLVRYARIPRTQPPVTRKAVLAIYGHRCVYCGKAGADSVDHVRPVSRAIGNPNVWGNVVAACQSKRKGQKSCNGRKGDRLLSELGWPAVRPIVPTRAQVLAAIHRNQHPSWKQYLNPHAP